MNDLEELRRIRNEANARIWQAEREERDRENAALIGKTYKYSNSYGSGERWWLYTKITGTEDGSLLAFSFQETSQNEIRIETKQFYMRLTDGYQEIDPREYARAWDALLSKINAFSN